MSHNTVPVVHIHAAFKKQQTATYILFPIAIYVPSENVPALPSYPLGCKTYHS